MKLKANTKTETIPNMNATTRDTAERDSKGKVSCLHNYAFVLFEYFQPNGLSPQADSLCFLSTHLGSTCTMLH